MGQKGSGDAPVRVSPVVLSAGRQERPPAERDGEGKSRDPGPGRADRVQKAYVWLRQKVGGEEAGGDLAKRAPGILPWEPSKHSIWGLLSQI